VNRTETQFRTPEGVAVPAVDAETMARVDRVAVETVGLQLLQMMENAGRSLAAHARQLAGGGDTPPAVTVLAGGGGNGGGGLCAARHLANHGARVEVVLDRSPEELAGAARTQYDVLQATDAEVLAEPPQRSPGGVVVDAIIGYGLADAPRGRAAELIESIEEMRKAVLSLDLPSGVNATTGETPGVSVAPDRTLTLALPKSGLAGLDGDLFLADIGIPKGVYERVGLSVSDPFGDTNWVRLHD